MVSTRALAMPKGNAPHWSAFQACYKPATDPIFYRVKLSKGRNENESCKKRESDHDRHVYRECKKNRTLKNLRCLTLTIASRSLESGLFASERGASPCEDQWEMGLAMAIRRNECNVEIPVQHMQDSTLDILVKGLAFLDPGGPLTM
jgi:hypothetical protein